MTANDELTAISEDASRDIAVVPREHPPDSPPGVASDRRARLALLGVAALGAVLVTAVPGLAVGKVAILAVSSAACAVLVVLERRLPRLGLRPVSAAIGVVLLVAVAMPPRASNDLWSYTMYGRTVAVHGASPYERVPADYPSDPFSARVSSRWAHRGSVYGPAFVALAAGGALLAGDSPLASRLLFQMSAAAALIGILAIVWRRTRSPAVLVWLGLNPVMGVLVVNGGHNDALVGLALLAAAMLVSRGRGRAAGLFIGLATLIKITALLGLLGVVLWAWRRGRRRLAVSAAVTTGLVVVLAYLPVLGAASRVLGESNRTVTGASAWNPLADQILGHDAWRDVPRPLAWNPTLSVIFFVSLAVVLLLAVILGWRAANARRAEPAVGTAVASYTMAAEYTFPWYAAWALPVYATRRISTVAWVVWVQSIVMLAALKLPNQPARSVSEAVVRALITQAAPILMLVCFVAAVIYEHNAPKTSASYAPSGPGMAPLPGSENP